MKNGNKSKPDTDVSDIKSTDRALPVDAPVNNELPHRVLNMVLTVGEVARLKGVTRAAVYAAIAQGRLSSLRILGRICIAESDAKVWLPVRWSGRSPGIPMSADAKRRIAASQKRRWQQRQQTNSRD